MTHHTSYSLVVELAIQVFTVMTVGLKYSLVNEEKWRDDQGTHFLFKTELIPDQTLVGDLEIKEYRFTKKSALRELHRLRDKIVSIIFDPYGDDNSEVVAKTLVGTCPFCGVSRELRNSDWELCYNYNEDRFEDMPYKNLEALCDLSYSFDRAIDSSRTRDCFIYDVGNLRNAIWTKYVALSSQDISEYPFGRQSPFQLYELYTWLGADVFFRKARKLSNNQNMVTELGNGSVALGSPGPYKGIYAHWCELIEETSYVKNRAYYLASPSEFDLLSLNAFKLTDHVSQEIETRLDYSADRVELLINEEAGWGSTRLISWDIVSGSMTLETSYDSAVIIEAQDVLSCTDLMASDFQAFQKRIDRVDSDTCFFHSYGLDDFGLEHNFFLAFGNIGEAAESIMNDFYYEIEEPMEDRRATLFGAVLAVSLANRFRSYPPCFYESIMAFSFESLFEECRKMNMLPKDFKSLEEGISCYLKKVGLPDTEPLQKACLENPQLLGLFALVRKFPFKQPEHVEAFLLSENGPFWLSELVRWTMRKGDEGPGRESALERKAAQDGEDAEWQEMQQHLNNPESRHRMLWQLMPLSNKSEA